MRATRKGALAALTIMALTGCAAEGGQSPTAPPTASASVAPTATTSQAAAAIARNKPQLLEAMQRFQDQDCAYFPAGATCAADRAAIARLADAMQKDLDRTAPWAAEVEDLADKTASRLAAVAILAEDPKRPANMIDTELTLLTRDLQSWSAYGG